MKIKVGIISLGCARNLVDSEVMLGYFNHHGMRVVDDIAAADVAVVNTCAFIKEAKEESIEMILKLIALKKEGRIKKIVIAGCLAQRYLEELKLDLKEVDGFIGPGGVNRIKEVVIDVMREKHPAALDPLTYLYSHNTPRQRLTPRHSAYVKVAEGCRNRCSYCIISRIRGQYRSRSIADVLKEINGLARSGAKEINLISQDTSLYGIDLYGLPRIAPLVRRISNISSVKWLRLLYNHPAHINEELIREFGQNRKLCRYLDLPLQHINDTILKKMNRHTTKKAIRRLLEKLRRIPDMAIRTTFIVGFPGETEKQFRELRDFMHEARFERLGIFIYSREEKTPAFDYRPQIPEKEKVARFNLLMAEQQKIAAEINERMIGREIEVIADEIDQSDSRILLCRTEYDAPEVDGLVFVTRAKPHQPGDFLKVRITGAQEYDLIAEELA